MILPHLSWSLGRFHWRWLAIGSIVRPVATLCAPVTARSHFSTPSFSEETPSMVAIREQPYPYLGLNLDIFEDNLGEYGAGEVLYPEITAARNPCHVLAQLVKEGNFEDAVRVRSDLIKIGVEIEKDFVYYRMALHVLGTHPRRTRTTNEQRCIDFMNWWSLVPSNSHRDARDHSFIGVVHAVFSRSAIPDIPLALHFALSSASKGYGRVFAFRAVGFLVRYAPPSVSLKFLSQFIDADSDYAAQHAQHIAPGRYMSMFAYAIRVHCMAGRSGAAMDVCRTAHSRGIRLTDDTYEFLQARLAQSNLSTDIEPLPDWPEGFEVPPNRRSPPPAILPAPSATSPLYVLSRYFKKSLRSGLPISTSLLAIFFRRSKAAGYTKALEWLRRRAYRSSNQAQSLSQWALAEMLHHFTTSSTRGVFVTYAYHFHAVGVPVSAAKFMNRLSRTSQLPRTQWIPVEPVVAPRLPLRHKSWASSHHTALIWRIVVSGAESAERLRALYQELLDQIQLARSPDGLTNAGDNVSNPMHAAFDPSVISTDPARHHLYLQPVPSPVQFDSAHFNAFIDAFMNRGMVSEATTVFLDMAKLDVQPNLGTFNKMLKGFARFGDLSRLYSLLTRMEDEPAVSASHGPSRTGTPQFLRPSEVTYMVVIRQLMFHNQHAAALEVAKRLFVKGEYVTGTNNVIDSLLEELMTRVETPQEPQASTAWSSPR